MRNYLSFIILFFVLSSSACGVPKIKLFPSAFDPLQEFTLKGKEKGKVLVIPIRGMISDSPKKGFISTKPSLVQEVVAQLRKAEKDKEVRAILLKIDSSGGSVTASDMLYHELVAFKRRTGTKVVAALMGVAASGGYYISLPADYILAHPTTVTGSIGVIFLRPDLTGLMEKIGVDVDVSKTGQNKDMGSPFRQTTAEEKKIIQDLTDQLGKIFLKTLARHRKIDQKTLKQISSARVYLAADAKQLGLIDKIGYLDDAVKQAKKLAKLPENAKIVVYRRSDYPDDNLYNASTTRSGGRGLSVISLGLPASLTGLQTGFYYLWYPAAMDK